MHLSIYLSIHPSIYLSIHPSIDLSNIIWRREHLYGFNFRIIPGTLAEATQFLSFGEFDEPMTSYFPIYFPDFSQKTALSSTMTWDSIRCSVASCSWGLALELPQNAPHEAGFQELWKRSSLWLINPWASLETLKKSCSSWLSFHIISIYPHA